MIGSFLIERPKKFIKRTIDLFRNPSSVYVAILFAFQISSLVFLAVFLPICVRYLILPSSIQREIPLNLVFSPCSQDLHGICSFPTAQLDVAELEVFSPSIHYQISVKLYFSEAESNFAIGLFQNELTLKDSSDNAIGYWRRTGLLKQPGWFTKVMWVCFFPLYLAGFFHNYAVLEIPIVGDYFSSIDRPPVSLIYSLQDRFAQVDSAVLLVNAKFGLIRHFLYYWPILSFMIMFLCFLMVGAFCLAVFWGHKSYNLYKHTKEDENNAKKCKSKPAVKAAHHPRPVAETSVQPKSNKKVSPSIDEFIPDNVDETPECPVLVNFPGWNTAFYSPNGSPRALRKRK